LGPVEILFRQHFSNNIFDTINKRTQVALTQGTKMQSITPVYRPMRHQAISIVMMALEITTMIVCLFQSPCCAYSPIVDPRAIAGLWKLKQKSVPSSISHPLKEFTVYPKIQEKHKISANNNKEVLLMLKEDGSFQQYSDQEEKVPDKLRFFQDYKSDEKSTILDRYCDFGKLKGKWSLIGGKLVLATDRPMQEDGTTSSIPKTNEENPDTILEGEVVATTEEGLYDNPALSSHLDDSQVNNSQSTDADTRKSYNSTPEKTVHRGNNAKSSQGRKEKKHSIADTHLSVPKGQVNVGRFTYPQRHPSFFEAPMFNPRASGKFELKQVLGSLNTQQLKDKDEFEEKFSESDFYDKTFLLTSHPIPDFQPKGNVRWSIKQNKFVEDPPRKLKNQKNEEKMMDQPIHKIRVLEIKFFANNTFATIGGIGSDVLRGKFSVIGKNKDHIWMQINLFGFGRSVTGSVFSEGKSLTKDDEKAYWGEIEYKVTHSTKGRKKSIAPHVDQYSKILDQEMDDSDPEEINRKLMVKGSILFGFGLEPMPVGHFVLAETNAEEEDVFDDEDEEDIDEEDQDDNNFNRDNSFFDSGNAFQ